MESKDFFMLPETNSSPLQMDGWNTTFLLGRPIFRGYVSFREGMRLMSLMFHIPSSLSENLTRTMPREYHENLVKESNLQG